MAAVSSLSASFSTTTEAAYVGHTLTSAAGVRVAVLHNGCVQDLSVGPHQINLLTGHPLGGGAMRIVLRRHTSAGLEVATLVGPGSTAAARGNAASVQWAGEALGVEFTVELALHPQRAAWQWQVQLLATSAGEGEYDVVLVQDVGLAGRGQILNNEAYTSQYIDHQILEHPECGPVLLARQNLAQHAGQHPWLLHACVDGASGALTDGFDCFGVTHRADGKAAALHAGPLPIRRRQYELSCHTLESRPLTLEPGQRRSCRFVAIFAADHPAASGAADLATLDELLASDPFESTDAAAYGEVFTDPAAVALARPILRPGIALNDADIAELLGEADEHRHRETLEGKLASFFGEDGQHVVLQHKELAVDRRHGHLLLAGQQRLPGGASLCSTGYMHGVLASHVCLGNTSFNKLLSVSRDPLNLQPYAGLRLWVREAGGDSWQQLSVASAFDMGLSDCVWTYQLDDACRVSITASVAPDEGDAAPALQWQVRVDGRPLDLRITAHLVVGDREHDQPCHVELDAAAGCATLRPGGGLLHERYPAANWTVQFDEPPMALGGDELLFADGQRRGWPYLVAELHAVQAAGWTITGKLGAVAAGQSVLTDRIAAQPQTQVPQLSHEDAAGVSRLSDVLPWFAQNAAIHLTAPHGIEQYGGAAWGVRDVCQGPVEWLLGVGETATVRRILLDVMAHQYQERGDWPQWYMHPPFETIQSDHCHGDVAVWPIIATVNYLEATDDLGLLDAAAGFTADQGFALVGPEATVREHLARAIARLRSQFVPGTALLRFGDGDWNDSLQPAQPAMRETMISTWTVELFYQALRRYAGALRRTGREEDQHAAKDYDATADAISADFERYLVPDEETAGLLLFDADPAKARPLLHPRDQDTGVHHRLLPMNDGILSHLFSPEAAQHHLGLIREHLLAPDGARLMDQPPRYTGGLMQHFQRAESASFFGREVGLMYTHAHLRYAEAMLELGEAQAAYDALLTVNPIGIRDAVPNALPRQANTYFSSSDADFLNRDDAAARYDALKRGDVPVQGGWRVYSSGPGIFVGLIVRKWLGLRRVYDRFVVDPVLPRRLDGLRVSLRLEGYDAELLFRVGGQGYSPVRVEVGGRELEPLGREHNPYRAGGLSFAYDKWIGALQRGDEITVVLP